MRNVKWPVINFPSRNLPSDQSPEEMLIDLEKLKANGFLRVLWHKGENGYHLKLVLNKRQTISLFVFNAKILQGQKTLVRSYGIWPIEVIEPDEEDKIIAEGSYKLENGFLELNIKKAYKALAREGIFKYKLKLLRVKEYSSAKHGYSLRPEYLVLPI